MYQCAAQRIASGQQVLSQGPSPMFTAGKREGVPSSAEKVWEQSRSCMLSCRATTTARRRRERLLAMQRFCFSFFRDTQTRPSRHIDLV